MSPSKSSKRLSKSGHSIDSTVPRELAWLGVLDEFTVPTGVGHACERSIPTVRKYRAIGEFRAISQATMYESRVFSMNTQWTIAHEETLSYISMKLQTHGGFSSTSCPRRGWIPPSVSSRRSRVPMTLRTLERGSAESRVPPSRLRATLAEDSLSARSRVRTVAWSHTSRCYVIISLEWYVCIFHSEPERAIFVPFKKVVLAWCTTWPEPTIGSTGSSTSFATPRILLSQYTM